MVARRRPTRLPPSAQANTVTKVRLQKALADAGMGSRREIETWIRAGRVQVNGSPAKLGDRVGPSDRVRVDGKEVVRRGRSKLLPRVIAYNKPEGELVTRHDPHGRATVFSRLPTLKEGRWIAVGRLDINTSGLLLLTNNGELANRLMHPSRALEREYAVRVFSEVPKQALWQLTHGVELEDGPARFEEIVESGGEGVNRWFHVLLVEGRKREVRRLWEAAGCRVSRLIRVRFGNVVLGPRVFKGRWRELANDEIEGLLALAGMREEGRRVRKAQAAGSRRGAPADRSRTQVEPRRQAQVGRAKSPAGLETSRRRGNPNQRSSK